MTRRISSCIRTACCEGWAPLGGELLRIDIWTWTTTPASEGGNPAKKGAPNTAQEGRIKDKNLDDTSGGMVGVLGRMKRQTNYNDLEKMERDELSNPYLEVQ